MLSIPLDEVVTPGLVVKVAGEGLPLPAATGQLKVRHFHIAFLPAKQLGVRITFKPFAQSTGHCGYL